MINLSNETIAREKYLSDIIRQKEEALKNAPEGFLRATPHRKTVQFYIRTPETGRNGRYLKNSERPLAKALAQKEYDKRVLASAQKEHTLLKNLNRFYEKGNTVEAQFSREPKIKRPEIIPIELPDSEYIDKWLSIPYQKLEIQSGTNEYFSDNEEQMRSKSEVIIANMLKRYNIPYRYECPLKLGTYTVYPDFTILNVSLRKEIYWEHLGMLDDQEYLDKNLRKISKYQMNGYYPGDRLILTYESINVSLNMKVVDNVIRAFCI